MAAQAPIPILAFAPQRWAAMPPASQSALAQLGKTRSIFVVEPPEPVARGGREFWELNSGAGDLLVCRPRVATSHEAAAPAAPLRMARALLHWLDIQAFVAWLYAPATPPAVQTLAPSLVIHDRSLEPARPRATASVAMASKALAADGVSGAA